MLGPRAQVGLLIGVLGCCGWGWAEAPWAGAPRAVAGDELDPWAGALWTGVSPLGRSEYLLLGNWWAGVPWAGPPRTGAPVGRGFRVRGGRALWAGLSTPCQGAGGQRYPVAVPALFPSHGGSGGPSSTMVSPGR